MGVTQAIMDAYFNGDISAEKAKELLAPPAAPKVECKAPEGYVECSKKCGRWTSPAENPRQRCNACQPGTDFYMAEYPDWAPPLESKPAETGKSGHTCVGHCGARHCDCDKCSDNAQAAPPAPEAPKAIGPVCGRSGKPGHMKCEGPVLSRVLGHKDDGAVAALYCELAMRQWEIRAFHNTKSETTPYAGPERLPRPRLAHIAGMHDDDLVGR